MEIDTQRLRCIQLALEKNAKEKNRLITELFELIGISTEKRQLTAVDKTRTHTALMSLLHKPFKGR